MLYNKTKVNGAFMPFLMGCTQPETIREQSELHNPTYNPFTQLSILDLRQVGTYSLKQHSTKSGKGTVTDRKNEIDDQKTVR